jgi:hypothetical protein
MTEAEEVLHERAARAVQTLDLIARGQSLSATSRIVDCELFLLGEFTAVFLEGAVSVAKAMAKQ